MPVFKRKLVDKNDEKDDVYVLEKIVRKYQRFVTKKNETDAAAILQYEDTINEARIVYCGCGVAMIGSSLAWKNCSCDLHTLMKLGVFDPACSEACREQYNYYCKCGSVLGRVFGEGFNGDLLCSNLCNKS